MKIILNDISKRYTKQWVLKKVNFTFESGNTYGIRGSNGSGKSTLMKIIADQLSATKGKITYADKNGAAFNQSEVKDQITFSAPYISPIENLNIREIYDFQNTFRHFIRDIDFHTFRSILDYPYKEDQYIKEYSSGMKQRLSLALSVLTESQLILLDEPTSFLDPSAKDWFFSLLKSHRLDRTVIISSNESEDLQNCSEVLNI